jgi:hypothetical protein
MLQQVIQRRYMDEQVLSSVQQLAALRGPSEEGGSWGHPAQPSEV